MEHEMTETARQLFDCMEKQKVGIRKTSLLTGISRNRIRQILHGAIDISIDEAAKLQTAFGVNMLSLASMCGNEKNAETLRSSDIDHPARYGGDTEYECIKVLKAWLSADEYRGFLKGNAIKYLCRLGKKDEPSKEIGKAAWYLDTLKETYGEEKQQPWK